MKVDRMFFEKFEDTVKADPVVIQQVSDGEWDQAINYITTELFDKPNEYFNLDKLRRAAGVDRRLGLREILEKAFGLIPGFKSKDDLLEVEFEYSLTNGELDIDKIINKSKRKRLMTVDTRNFEILAPKTQKYNNEFNKKCDTVLDVSSQKNPAYFAIFNTKNGKTKLIFEPTDKMLEAIRLYIPRKVMEK
jgi:hypothetical protein